VQPPVGMVHGDYTKVSAPGRLQLLGETPKINDTLRNLLGEAPLLRQEDVKAALSDEKRYMIINIWRSIDKE